MFSNWTFGQKIGAGFSVAALALLLVGLVGFTNTHRLIDNDNQVSHTEQVRRSALVLLSLLQDAETGHRGFIVTGLDSFLEPYTRALPRIEEVYEELRRQTADNAEQQRRLDAVRPVIAEKKAEMLRVLNLRRTEGLEKAGREMAAGAGKHYMDEIRRLMAEFDGEEQQLLDRRRQSAEESAHLTKTVILYGGLAGVVFIALIGWFLTHSLSRQIGLAVSHMQSSSAELQAAANQQATGAREQATAMSEITTTISELLATSRQIAESAQRVSQIAEQATSGARTGGSTVEQGLEAIAAIRRQVDLIVNHMLELGRKSQQIGSVLEIVSELAEQTNILAINATIEAAGAGEQGRRFAVVADEIRKLADRVTVSAKEIRGLIEDVRAAVNTTVMTTETGAKAVEAGSRQFGEVASAFRQIASQIVTTTDAAKEIGLSTKQQTTAVEQVNIAITNVAQASRESETSTSQTLQTASQLNGLSGELLRMVQPQNRSRPGLPA
jgi:methyl-accepting chemotaxis protein